MYKFILDVLKKINFDSIMLKIINCLIILILMFVIIKIGSIIINKATNRKRKFKFEMNERKLKTIGRLSKSILKYAVYFFGIIAILDQFLSTVTVTFAGIGGIVIGFGAQSFVKDIINGFFILFEDQYSVGDYVSIDDKEGIVQSLELRVTKIRDFNGDVHIIPNGLINKVTNHSRGNSKVVVEIYVYESENVDNAIKLAENVCNDFTNKNSDFLESPSVVGITQILKTGELVLRVEGLTKPAFKFKCEVELRRAIISKFNKNDMNNHYCEIKLVKE